MHFKRIEMVGFKSFMNKTKLKFEPGVTAVVGPNGCGKSNIVDAIKWVLGEQSTKSMRSSSMQDVIFNGTEKHEPLNMSEVSLVLSNEDGALSVDYDEVTITRRLFRSGDSEYLLNKTPVRLADIKSLLMGTGIGTSSYSVIEQGKLDMILSSKPEERRYIFEEASGITKYKSKKREALLKLEHTQDNLTRINDIIREVERQINSIERQARKAERYRQRYDEMKDLDIKLSYLKYRDLDKNDTQLGGENEGLRKRCEELKTKLDSSAAELVSRREVYRKTMDELQEFHNEVMRLGSEVDKNRHTVQVDRERRGELERLVERLDGEIEGVTERRDALRERIGGMEARLADVTSRREEKDRVLASSESKVRMIAEEVDRYRHELRVSREQTVDTAAEQTRARNTLIRMNADVQNMVSRKKRLAAQRDNMLVEKENIGTRLREAEERVRSVEGELKNKKEEARTFSEEYRQKEKQLSSLRDEQTRKEKRINEIKPRREFLEKLISEREGINESVKDIMERVESGDPRFSGVHGILSELIDVREGYEESLESVLGEFAQALVVETRKVADDVTWFLGENSMASVNFLILDELARLSPSEDRNIPGRGMLDDVTQVLSAKEPYSSSLRSFLKDTFVTVSPDAARSFIENEHVFRGRIIGEQGEVYQKGAHRSRNHSSREVTSLLGRQEKVRQLEEEERGLVSELDDIRRTLAGVENWFRDAASRKEMLEAELRSKESEYSDVSFRKSSIEDKMRSIDEEIKITDMEISQESEGIERITADSNKLEERIAQLEEESGRLQSAIDQAQKVIQDGIREREEALYIISDVKAELSALRKEEENLSENFTREKEIFESIERDVDQKKRTITESAERIRALETEIKALEEGSLRCIVLKEQKSSENEQKVRFKDDLSLKTAELEKTVRELESDLEASRDRLRDMDLRKKDYEYKRESILDKIKEAYKTDLRYVTPEAGETFDREGAEARIAELKDQIEKMGNVSLGAVEEHQQLQQRFEFLTRQRDDLAQARETLLQAIQKINRTTKKLFMESFEAIKKEFSDYFRMLFNGGKAEVILEDESNVLECGIDINVRPPGKKLQNIMLLSGGEKAMTAIALMFAIFKVNPSPFCILDEIDAPLDESNIVRFSRVLQEFLKLSQFIIVTHNRMTIQLADILYGITMEEKGVSKVVSVKFTEEKDIKDSVEVGV